MTGIGIEEGHLHNAGAQDASASKRAILGAGLFLAILLAAPGATATSKYLNDLMIFLDGAHRIVSGQVPNVDFHTSLGPLAFYIPAAGYALTGSLGAAMPVGMALVVLLLTPIGAEIVGSRMSRASGLPLAFFLLLVVAVPANPGEGVSELSFAMFYNRIGWAALGLLFVFYLPRRDNGLRRDLPDAGCAAALVLLMFYTKITYAIVGLGFLLLLATHRSQRRMAGLSLLLIAAAILLVELFWRGGRTYVEDLRLVSAVSAGFPGPERLVEVLSRNLADITSFGLAAILLLAVLKDIRDLLFLGFCLGSGVLIIEQNFQLVGILTLGAGAAVAGERLRRAPLSDARRRLARGMPLLLAALILPPSVNNLANLGLHAGFALGGRGEQIPLPRFTGVRLVPSFGPGTYERFRRYNAAIADGGTLLGGLQPAPQRVLVMDFANPFSAGLGLKPPRGDSPWYHWGRTIDARHFPPAEQIFGDAEIVMQPKRPIERYTGNGMRDIYTPYVTAHYRQIADTRDWRVFRRLP